MARKPKKIETPQLNLVDVGADRMTSYGTETIKNRSVPSLIDGLKPVQRRILWSMYDLGLKPGGGFKKASKVVGQAMGDYHPHGDSSIEQALTVMVGQTTSPIEGHGNWGTLTDGAAASRYIECRLSQWGWDNFFHPDYIGTIRKQENYDGSRQEPIYLFSNTLNLLVNGTSGIAVGATTNIPSFTLKSVNQCILLALKKKLTVKEAAKFLKLDSKYGGVMAPTPANKAALTAIIKDGKGSLEVTPVYTVKGKVIRITGFPAMLRTGRLLASLNEMPGVDLIEDLSDIKAGHIIQITTKNVQGKTQQAVIDSVIKKMTVRNSYNISYLTESVKDDEITVDFQQTGIVEMIESWLDWRRDAEKHSIRLKIEALNKQNARLNLMLLAHKNRKVLDDCRDQKDPGAYLKKKLKVDDEAVNFLLGLTVRQLTGLAKRDLIAEQKEVLAKIANHKKDLKKIDTLLEAIFKG